MDFKTSLAAYALRVLNETALPSVAADALVEGYDSPALRALAVESSTNAFILRQQLATVLEQLGLQMPGEEEAVERLLKFRLREIVDGQVEPVVGLQRVMDVYYLFPNRDTRIAGDWLGIERLVGLYWAWRDGAESSTHPLQPSSHQLAEIVTAARARLRSSAA